MRPVQRLRRSQEALALTDAVPRAPGDALIAVRAGPLRSIAGAAWSWSSNRRWTRRTGDRHCGTSGSGARLHSRPRPRSPTGRGRPLKRVPVWVRTPPGAPPYRSLCSALTSVNTLLTARVGERAGPMVSGAHPEHQVAAPSTRQSFSLTERGGDAATRPAARGRPTHTANGSADSRLR
jgi:hypothetical protein